MPPWISPFALIGAGVALMLGKSLPARMGGFLLIVAGATNPQFGTMQSVLFVAIGLAAVIGGWIVKLGR
ncbi:MAG: hypothetical protein ACAI43_17850 [Phycisphaerae bacterium]|nr:hypothetical protein [Tepidisphaeraceae bacterium]HYE19866.1 hypothetical protein [Tepidisphaeraceae bacterium]